MADDPLWLDTLGLSGAEIRRALAALVMANGSAAGSLGGVRPGDPGLKVTCLTPFTTVGVAAGVAALAYPGQGVYLASLTSAFSTALTAPHATLDRIDAVWYRVWDNAVDGAGLAKSDIVYTAGTPAASPVAPSTPGAQVLLLLATIYVPHTGGSSPAVTDARIPLVGPGAISPSATTPGIHTGQYRDTATTSGTLQRFNGTSWEDVLRLALGGHIDVGGSGLSAAYSAAGALSSTEFLKSQVTGDTIARFLALIDGTLAWGGGAGARDVTLTRSAAGILALAGALTVSTGLSVAAGVGSRRHFVKPSDTPRTSNTTYADDAYFVAATMTLEANATYRMDGYLKYAGAANGSGDMKLLFTGPAGWTMTFGTSASLSTSVSGFDGTAVSAATGRIIGTNGGTTDMGARVTGTITTAGTTGGLALQWAQNTSSGTSTILRGGAGGSWITLERMA